MNIPKCTEKKEKMCNCIEKWRDIKLDNKKKNTRWLEKTLESILKDMGINGKNVLIMDEDIDFDVPNEYDPVFIHHLARLENLVMVITGQKTQCAILEGEAPKDVRKRRIYAAIWALKLAHSYM